MRNIFLPVVALCLFVTGCSTAPASNSDPLEPLNRSVFEFNQVVDGIIIRPVAAGYRAITPQPVRNHVGNVADNLFEPLSMVNSLLQGDVQGGMKNFWRFVINSTVGLAGINDVASTAGLSENREDFGQTLAVWGVGSGPYIVLPILGPSNGRDTVGIVTDWFINPVNYAVDDGWTSAGIAAGQAVVRRERLLDPIDDINASSIDPYATFRSIYEQRRAAQITNRPAN